MLVNAKSLLRNYWQKHPEAEEQLQSWYKLAEKADWSSGAELKETFPQADCVGDCVVFNIGNQHRVIGRVRYNKHRLYLLKILPHKEYDKNKWPGECGCHEPPPKLPTGQRVKPTIQPEKSARPARKGK